jgi:hypothetical protein
MHQPNLQFHVKLVVHNNMAIVTTFAGSGVASYANGTGTNATFNNNVADTLNHIIRKISPAPQAIHQK